MLLDFLHSLLLLFLEMGGLLSQLLALGMLGSLNNSLFDFLQSLLFFLDLLDDLLLELLDLLGVLLDSALDFLDLLGVLLDSVLDFLQSLLLGSLVKDGRSSHVATSTS